MSRVAVRELAVDLGGRPVVTGLSMTVEAGRWAALIGPNGAGKTTTLRAIAGLVAYRGEVSFDGRAAEAMRSRQRARRVAVVPQMPVTPADMTVADYVLLGRTPHMGYFGQDGPRDRAAASRALKRLELVRFAERRLGSLSGGERQRVVLARALAQEAEVVLLDEPTSALDLARQQQVLELVDCLREQEGLAVVAAMHDLTAVALYCDQVQLLSQGRVVCSGTPRQVLRQDTLGEHFGAAVRVFEHRDELVVVAARGGGPA